MAERPLTFEEGEYYHVYNRGVDKRRIFFSKGDWTHFQRLLFLRNTASDKKINLIRLAHDSVFQETPGTEPLVDILAYALMENHFHLLLHERVQNGISTFMRKLLTSYAMYMNKKYDRTGPLMCRPFRAKHIDSDEYLRWIISYIHLNPLDQIAPNWKEHGIDDPVAASALLENYRYGSYIDYIHPQRPETTILNKHALPIDITDVDNLDGLLAEYTAQSYFDTKMF